MSKLPHTLLHLNLNYASTSLISVGLGLALLGFNAKVVSANPLETADNPDADDIDSNLIDAALAKDGDIARGPAIPTLVELQQQESEAISPVLTVESSAPPTAPLRFRLPPESDSISEADEAALIAQMADPNSALSQLPASTAQAPFEASSAYQPPQPEPDAVSLADAAHLSSDDESEPQLTAVEALSSTQPLGELDAQSVQAEPDQAEIFQSTASLPLRSVAIDGVEDEVTELASPLMSPVEIVVEPFERIAPSNVLLANGLTPPFSLEQDIRAEGTELSNESDRSLVYAFSDKFLFQPPVVNPQLTEEAIAYRPDFVAPSLSVSTQSTVNNLAGRNSDSSSSRMQIPMATLHPALPMASLDMGVSQRLADAPTLVAVPANPPSGRSSSHTLPPPPSLPSIVAVDSSLDSQLIAGLSTESESNALVGLTPSPQAVMPIPATWTDSAPAPTPQTSVHVTAIPVPDSAPWNQPITSSWQPDGSSISPTWSSPELTALETAWQAVVQTATATSHFNSPDRVGSSAALTSSWMGSSQTSTLNSSPEMRSNAASFNPFAPFSPAVVLPRHSLAPDSSSTTRNGSAWGNSTSQTVAVPMPIAASQPWSQNSLNASASLIPGNSDPWASSQVVSTAAPTSVAAAPTAFNSDDPFEAPLQSVPDSWTTPMFVGQTLQGQPIIIPAEPIQGPVSQQQGQSPQPTFSPTPSSVNGFEATEIGRDPVTQPSLQFQGGFILVDDDASARARLTGIYPFTPQILVGGTIDLTEGQDFSDTDTEGLSINELYLAASLRDLPNLRFVIGQLDLTSYFDRNSFAKDSLTHFFNPVFQTNPALASSSIGSRLGALINFNPTDNFEIRAAAFSSDRAIGDFELDGFAGELGYRIGNLILRGTYVSARDGGTNDGPAEIFGFDRGDDVFGIEEGDREEAFGFNAEYFIPEVNLGLFARYGRYENLDADFVGDTFSAGLNVLDVFMPNDRIGLAYGRALSNDDFRQDLDNKTPDVLELFYDFPILDNFRLGFTLQQRDEFSETVAGFRIRTTFDIFPR
jgi:hypothetical protein